MHIRKFVKYKNTNAFTRNGVWYIMNSIDAAMVDGNKSLEYSKTLGSRAIIMYRGVRLGWHSVRLHWHIAG